MPPPPKKKLIFWFPRLVPRPYLQHSSTTSHEDIFPATQGRSFWPNEAWASLASARILRIGVSKEKMLVLWDQTWSQRLWRLGGLERRSPRKSESVGGQSAQQVQIRREESLISYQGGTKSSMTKKLKTVLHAPESVLDNRYLSLVSKLN